MTIDVATRLSSCMTNHENRQPSAAPRPRRKGGIAQCRRYRGLRRGGSDAATSHQTRHTGAMTARSRRADERSAEGKVSYRSVPIPATGFTSTREWVAYARDQQLLRSLVPHAEGACDYCHGAVGCDDGGSPYQTCYQCGQYYLPFEQTATGWRWPTPVLAKVVPITYSLDEGFESLLHNYKRSSPGPLNTARAALIGSILAEFLPAHRPCLDAIAGAITHATTVPPRVQRSFDPMVDAIGSITGEGGSDPWGLVWDHGLVMRTTARAHRRGEMDARYYELGPGRDVTGGTVLVVDDTWTSGVSMASVACRLRQAGAAAVVGVPLGRQVGSNDYGMTRTLRDQVLQRDWTPSTCVVCG